MLVNFCDSSLRTDITCSTVSTEGYEAENLINNSEKGFLAYACIKPPVSIDFSFICNVQISHVIVWPQIGAQKSSGFQLSVKSTDSSNQPFIDVSSAFLQKTDTGLLFYRRDITNYTEITLPNTFLKRYIKTANVVNYANVLRLRIIKTDNSVPALSKIEIWGTVSPKCGKDVASNVMALWMNRHNSLSASQISVHSTDYKNQESNRGKEHNNLLNVPEDFLDPITFEIMTQPIVLPSGKIIDQMTLEKHGQTEAIWGRPVSDPFTGIRFSETRKPVAAFSLKARIDKFLLENSNSDEVKQLPRVLGSKVVQQRENVKLITCQNVKAVNIVSTSKNNHDAGLKKRLAAIEENSCNNIKRSFYGHSLPVASVRISTGQIAIQNKSKSIMKKQEIAKQNAVVEEKLNSSIKLNSALTCKCCTNSIFYKLPCDHVICRQALLSLESNKCAFCNREFERSDLQRFHLHG
ncbi:RING finger protein 37 [Phymastichus coffea]|uniref:RING finger protein 37 n=1 Tax=Phymastichus coffea TaxID=108790 RepID=UPI00273C94A7|nr:RING finger protein 37 [Phymastichus coffea]